MRNGTSPDLTLFESQAIAAYIDKAFPGPKFFPEDAVGAARTVQWTSYVNAKVDRWIMREFVVPSVFFDKSKGPDTARIAAALPDVRWSTYASSSAGSGSLFYRASFSENRFAPPATGEMMPERPGCEVLIASRSPRSAGLSKKAHTS